jgi:hypothetical protein
MHAVSRFALAAALVIAGSTAFAAKVQSVPRTAPPSASQVSAFGLPKPAGLPGRLPGDLSDTSNGNLPSTVMSNGNTETVVGGNGVNTALGGDTVTTAVGTTVLGAGASVPGPSQGLAGAGGYSAVDLARWFYFADTNHDGELTRAEFNRLPVKPMGFEQMDRNFDGVITRFEYEDAFR